MHSVSCLIPVSNTQHVELGRVKGRRRREEDTGKVYLAHNDITMLVCSWVTMKSGRLYSFTGVGGTGQRHCELVKWA
jgi:hypothetical protein